MKLFVLTLITTALLSSTCLLMQPEQPKPVAGLQWKYPHAGVVLPKEAAVLVSSGSNAKNITDNNTNTFWQSEAPFPVAYLTRNDQNLLLYSANSQSCTLSGSAAPQPATDGNAETGVKVDKNGLPEAQFTLHLTEPQQMLMAGVKAGYSGNLQLFAQTASGKTVLLHRFTNEENYTLIRFAVQETSAITALSFNSTQPFTLFEISALGSLPTEYAVLDLGTVQPVGLIETRHWATNPAAVVKTDLWYSTDNKQWIQAADLNAKVQGKTALPFMPPLKARYVKLQHTIADADWAKAEIWEIAVYDTNGCYGAMPLPSAQKHTMQQLLGINGIWGWGYNQCSMNLPPNKGPQQFARVAFWGRNYHNLDWDVTDPDHVPKFEQMALGKGTEAQPWLNWNNEYAAWKNAGLSVQVSVQFTNAAQPASSWNNAEQAAFNYGYAFANNFGKNNLVTGIEIGNEPWDYSPAFYRTVFHGMAQGVKAANNGMKVLPCALQAHNPNAGNLGLNNYISDMLSPDDAHLLDALNIHAYSFMDNTDGKRIAVYPEHICSEMRSLVSMLRFRDANLPDLPVQLTEWGWDSGGANEDCLHNECVTETEQALYAVRGALMASRCGVDRLFWYFYANGTGGSSVFNRSGLVSSEHTGFLPKKSYKAMKALVNLLGNTRFTAVMKEDDIAWVYALKDETEQISYLVAWRPISGTDTSTIEIHVNSPQKPVNSLLINGQTETGYEPVNLPYWQNGVLKVRLSAAPLVVKMAD